MVKHWVKEGRRRRRRPILAAVPPHAAGSKKCLQYANIFPQNAKMFENKKKI